MTQVKRVVLTDARTGRTEYYSSPPWSLLALDLAQKNCIVTLKHESGQTVTVHVSSSASTVAQRFADW
ncbi:hypothetical protein SAMN06265221_105257 [Paracoccus laeviglucosivorans]|uniref:Uncharacterized protein n=1 Tax=Paracoccus laeviglucosivorans TaxID=1197861 RepID=A0A521CXG1_9RHOB|nr:hypothetical protein SAMN06265221_105257 [Paracoccus laeviglucosivorans]